jgi:ribosomal protein S18 acetylase RimI-like enzyme
MRIREIKLPEDFDLMQEIITNSFHYPENPDWNIADDELEGFVDTVNSLKKIWPIMNIAGLFSKTIKHLLMGYIAEVDGIPAGIFMCQRRGSTDKWYVSTVGVLPEFRRRGIARKLVESGIALIKELDGEIALLDVISGNLPAYSLYVDVGFEHYTGLQEYKHKDIEHSQIPEIPKGFELVKLNRYDWKTRFNLMDTITPDKIKEYEPVEVGRFKQPVIMRIVNPLIKFAQGQENIDQVIMYDGKIMGRMHMSLRKKSGGRHNLTLYMDKEYPKLAEFCVAYMLGKIAEMEDGKTLTTAVEQWQPHVSEAFTKFGFEERVEGHRLGLKL